MDRWQELMLEKGRLRRVYASTNSAHSKAKVAYESAVKNRKSMDENILRAKKISKKDYVKAILDKEVLEVKITELKKDKDLKYEDFKKVFARQRENLNERRKIINEHAEGQLREEVQKMQEG